ncbi:MAG: GAF domain-containing protein [Burkholderiales bacterium]|nr:GAF domain-containing protein [Burkholderiales bacterium]
MLKDIKQEFIARLEQKRQEILPQSPPEYLNIIADAVHTSMNLISSSDALYHDVEHTCMVTLCGQEIFAGKKTLEGELNASDWLHFTLALLFHDIGYVKNILTDDSGAVQVTNSAGDTHSLEGGDTDAALTPYHVERGKLFIRQRNWHRDIDKVLLENLISYTQFPIPDRGVASNIEEEKFRALAGLVGSADLIGQLADPMYDIKIPRLFYEFSETGSANKMGYQTPDDLRASYPAFFLNFVKPHIGDALKYLHVSDEGKNWISSLNYHVFSQSHKAELEKSGIELLSEITKIKARKYRTEELIVLILEKICKYKAWPLGHAYSVQRNNDDALLRSMKIWYSKKTDKKTEEFKVISEGYVFKSGEGLPGRVCETGAPQTIFDVTADPNFPRAKLANDIGVRGAFAFPLSDGLGVRWVLEFFSPDPEILNPSVLELMKHVSTYISEDFNS